MLTIQEAEELLKKQNPFLVSFVNRTDSKTATLNVTNPAEVATKIKNYFIDVLLKETNENELYYFMSVLSPSFWRLNPCIVEVKIDKSNVTIVTYAKEGLIKQNTCQRAINDVTGVILNN